MIPWHLQAGRWWWFLLWGLAGAALPTAMAWGQLESGASPRLKALDQLVFAKVTKQPEEVYDSARIELQLAREEGFQGFESQACSYLASIWNWRNELDSSLYYAQLSLEVGLRSGLNNQIATGYNTMGIVYDLRGQLDSALAAYGKSLEWSRKTDDKKGIARALLNLGMVQRTKGEFLLSLERLHEAEAYCLEWGFVNYLPNLYLTIGNVYQLIGEQDLAWENLHEALRRARRGEKFRIMAATMEALGDHAAATGDVLEALCWYETSLQTAHDAQIRSQEGQSSAKASRIYLSLGQMEAATVAAKLAVKIAAEDHDTVSLGRAHYALGMVDLHTQRYASAVQNCERAYRYSRQSSQTNALMEVCDCLWRSGEKAGQGELALHYYQEYIGLRDSLFNRDNNMAIARLEARLDYERRHAADSLAQATANLRREATYRAELAVEQEWSRIILWITVASILMACLGGMGVAIFRRQNHRLSSQNETIRAQNEAIESALQEKEVLLREVHHRVKNNLQVMISLLELQSDGIEDSRAREVLLASRGRVEAMTLIHQKLHQQQNLSGLEFGTYLRQLVEALQEVYPIASSIDIDFRLGECSLGIDTAVPLGLILNELVTNAFKHAYSGRAWGKLRVSLESNGAGSGNGLENNGAGDGKGGSMQSFALVVEDDGVGLPKGFDLQNANTLGLQLVKGLSRQLRGRMVAEHSTMGGAKMIITFQSQNQ